MIYASVAFAAKNHNSKIKISDGHGWIQIIPMPYCPNFTAEYSYAGNYKLRYKASPSAKSYTLIENGLDDLNNLSTLTDDLEKAAMNFCKTTYTVNYKNENIICSFDLGEKPFSDQYANMLSKLIKVVDNQSNNCGDVIPLIKLQNHITNLEGDNLLHFNKSRQILKLFTGSETDKLIDHFYECGGERGTKQFIENLILIEAKNACLFPAPPGLLSLEKAQAIAKEVANEFPNLGLIGLNSKSDDITKNAIVKFADKIFTDQVTNLVGPKLNSKKIVNNLTTYKRLKKEKPSRILDHMRYITSVEAPLEILDETLPTLVRENFRDLLPKEMSLSAKRDYLDKNITPLIKTAYNSCIADAKKKIGYPSTGKTKKVIKNRKKMQKNFCKLNPDNCGENQCGGPTKNFLTDRADISDMAVIQACVYSSIEKAINPVLKKVIFSQKKMLSEYMDITDAQLNTIGDDLTTELNTCVLKTVENASGKTGKEALLFTSTSSYQQAITSCGSVLEEKITSDFGIMVISNIDAVKKIYSNNETITVRGQELDKGTVNFSKEIIKNTIPHCNKLQAFRAHNNDALKASTINCKTLIEISAAEGIIKNSLNDALADIDEADRKKTIEDYRQCTSFVKTDIEASLLNPDHKTPIVDSKTSSEYLSKNPKFYNCLTSAITKSSELISDKVILEKIDELTYVDISHKKTKKQAASIKDEEYFMEIKDSIKEKVKSCFAKELKRIGSWGNFLEANAKGDITKIQDGCTARATEYTLPLIIANETNVQLKGFSKVQLLGSGEKVEITDAISDQLILTYKLPKNLKVSGNNNKVLAAAFIKFKKLNPKSKDPISDFVEDYTKAAQYNTINTVTLSILDTIIETSKPGFDFEIMRTAVSGKCLDSFYEQNKAGINNLAQLAGKSGSSSGAPLKQVFVNLIQKGLIRSLLKGRFQNTLQKLKLICKNPENYKDLKKLIDTGVADEFLVSQIEINAKLAFNDAMAFQCEKSLEKLNINKLDLGVKDKAGYFRRPEYIICGTNLDTFPGPKTRKDLIKKISEKLKTQKEKNQFMHITNRQEQSTKLISRYIGNITKMDKLFLEDRSTLDFIYDNFDQVIGKNKSTANALNMLVMDKLFKDPTSKEFSKKFTEIQLITGIGETGFDIAQKRVNEKLVKMGKDHTYVIPFTDIELHPIDGLISEKITPYTNIEFQKRWTYSGIKNYLAMDKRTSKEQTRIQDLLYKNAIKARIDTRVSETKKTQLMGELVTEITNQINLKGIHANPDYVPAKRVYIRQQGHYIDTPAKGKSYLSFAEKLAIDIKKSVTEKIIDDYQDKAIDGGKSVLEALNPFSYFD